MPLVVGDSKITETVITVAQAGIPTPELSDGQGPIILSDIKLLLPLGPRERKCSQGPKGLNIRHKRGLEVGPEDGGLNFGIKPIKQIMKMNKKKAAQLE